MLPELTSPAGKAPDGTPIYGVDSVAMSALMLKGEQELFERESAQQKEIDALKAEIVELRKVLIQRQPEAKK